MYYYFLSRANYALLNLIYKMDFVNKLKFFLTISLVKILFILYVLIAFFYWFIKFR